jgi:hypothetical protein
MSILKQPLFLFCVLTASFVYVASKLQWPLPNGIYFYVNDFLCMPIVLGICLSVLRLIKKTDHLYVPFGVVLGLTVYFAVYFEWFMPQVSERYTSDFIDVILYFSGAFLFYRFQKKLF